MQRQKSKITDKQLSIILICGVLGFIIIYFGTIMYDYREVTPNFWSPTNPIITYPFRYWAPMFYAIGVFVIILGLAFSSMYAKGRDDLSFDRICLTCGRQVPQQAKFCPYCGETLERTTAQQQKM